ncbi:DUF935 domain-containing protein [Marivivens aquimaris]|uniref:DUF935 domain-containing protein n=1 Tax=Marivivens aquimaris TaxID=2774876 RepID=UPI0018829D27|nr:DUF935 domain-containing protein [Marivivens aquimaris]
MALLDAFGRPIERATLTAEIAAPTYGGVRTPMTGHPGDGLDPNKLAAILREAESGNANSYLELAEVIEERDPHYTGVLSTRRRSVSQLDFTVEAASEDPADVARADEVRQWLRRDELADEVFDMLDAIGKGYSITEIIWDMSMGQFQPSRLEYRDPRFFEFDRTSFARPLLRIDGGTRELPGFKFITTRLKAKSGLPLRSGLARIAMWSYLFKAFTLRDWAIFSATYGQPIRVGRYDTGASEDDRRKLFQAVANIAGDCAAIIPQSMQIEFVEAGNVGASSDLYEKRADWFDRQVSKLVLGQTATTDAVTGGLGSGKEHRQVQEDIERADAKALQAVVNAQLIRPWTTLNYGPDAKSPRVIIGRPEAEDLSLWMEGVGKAIDRGMRVSESEVRDKFGLADPDAKDRILHPMGAQIAPATPPEAPNDPVKRFSAPLKRYDELSGIVAPQAQERPSDGPLSELTSGKPFIAPMEDQVGPVVQAMIDRIFAMSESASDLPELREMIREAYPSIDTSDLTEAITSALTVAAASGVEAAAGETDA